MPKMPKTVSLYGVSIPQHIRLSMTIMPPPVHQKDGTLPTYPDEYVERYKSMAEMKRKHPVYIEEYVPDGENCGERVSYHMMIRCMSSAADLELIMMAAKHLELFDSYTLMRGEQESLDPIYESSFMQAVTTNKHDVVEVDNETFRMIPYVIDWRKRTKIWEGLFEAAGYTPVFGNAINIKKVNQ